MDSNIKDRIVQWIVIAKSLNNKGLHDESIRFFIYYICFDAWITHGSGKDRDDRKITWLIRNGGILKQVFINKEFDRQDAISLKTLSPIEDARPGYMGRLVFLNDPESFEEVVRFVYQIRCNLFHGGKSPIDNRDNDLVFSAGEFLSKWIERAISLIE